MAPTTRSREKTQKAIEKSNEKQKKPNELSPSNITIISKTVKKAFRKKRNNEGTSDNNPADEEMEVDEEDTQTVASTSSTTNSPPIQTAPQSPLPPDNTQEKGKGIVPVTQESAADNANTNQIVVPDDTIF